MASRGFQSPPALVGYNFTAEDARKARNTGTLLSMRLETSLACNFACIYCNGGAGTAVPGELTLAEMEDSISQVRDLGGTSVVIIGGGEPTIYPHFDTLVRFINRKGMTPVVITNASKLDYELTTFLYDHNASLLFKLDSLVPEKQDYLAGYKGAFALIMNALENLIRVGFHKPVNGNLRCGASFVLVRQNLDEIASIWRFCRENSLYPNLEEFIPRCRGSEHADELSVSREDFRRLNEILLACDRSMYGYDWPLYTPMPGHGCLQHFYSIYVSILGFVRPCADVDVSFFNVRNDRIGDIINSDFFQIARNIEKHLGGKCGRCGNHSFCVGCRGDAFCVGIKEGLTEINALCREDPLCWKDS